MINAEFTVPVCVIFFNRPDLVVRVIDSLKVVKPHKVYLFGDGPRDNREGEIDLVAFTRSEAEKAIDWECQIIKWYSEKNVGVYENIAGKALRVFEIEKEAIFLEDDNLPDITFFSYCEQMLHKYEEEERLLWICGSNFYPKGLLNYPYSYTFSQNLYPCGWASWAWKFKKYYDPYMEAWQIDGDNRAILSKIQYKGNIVRFYNAFNQEKRRLIRNERYESWDYQMFLSILNNDLLAVIPSTNLIKNIGVDERATHGSTHLTTQVEKFAPQQTKPLVFPLNHPPSVEHNVAFDSLVWKYLTTNELIGIYMTYIFRVKKIIGNKGETVLSFLLRIRKIIGTIIGR